MAPDVGPERIAKLDQRIGVGKARRRRTVGPQEDELLRNGARAVHALEPAADEALHSVVEYLGLDVERGDEPTKRGI